MDEALVRRLVALKVVRGTEIVDAKRLVLFEREAATLARLDHPNIGRIYESGRTEEGRQVGGNICLKGHYYRISLRQISSSLGAFGYTSVPTLASSHRLPGAVVLSRSLFDATAK